MTPELGVRVRAWTSVCTFLIASSPALPSGQAQSADERLRFEVGSIRLNTEAIRTTVGIVDNPSVVRIANLPLMHLIRMAYDVREAVGPGWLNDARFDIVAKPPAGYESRHLPTLLRNLLADRFNLVAHRETKQVQGFALRVEAGGRRLAESTSEKTFLTGRPGLIAGNSRTIAEFTALVVDAVSAPVVDQTGLAGRYDLKLEWTPQLSSAGAAPASQAELSVFTALREQMGLRLEPVPATIDIVVVDAVDKVPTEN